MSKFWENNIAPKEKHKQKLKQRYKDVIMPPLLF